MESVDIEQLRDKYLKLSKDELTEFDKNFFFVTAGIFAFSVTFIKDIVNIEFARCVIFLFLSWICTGVAIGCIIFSFYFSSLVYQKIAEALSPSDLKDSNIKDASSNSKDISKKDKDSIDKIILTNTKISKDLRLLSIITFLGGLLFLFVFLLINFYFSNNPKDKESNSLPSKESTLVPSKNNPVNFSRQDTKNDTIFHKTESSTISTSSNSIRIDSTILVIKPDTIYLKMQNNFYSPKKIKHIKKQKRCKK